jgi:hypothetical protein
MHAIAFAPPFMERVQSSNTLFMPNGKTIVELDNEGPCRQRQIGHGKRIIISGKNRPQDSGVCEAN